MLVPDKSVLRMTCQGCRHCKHNEFACPTIGGEGREIAPRRLTQPVSCLSPYLLPATLPAHDRTRAQHR
eukprot:6403060-Amphidinium_carterae.1